MDIEKIIKGIFAIKHLCKNRTACYGCKYYDPDNYKHLFCKFKTYPTNWNMEEITDILEYGIKEVEKEVKNK